VILNPLSEDAERIVRRHRGEKLVSGEVFEHARRLVEWRAGKRRVIPRSLLSGYDEEVDVLAQRLLFLTAALNFTPYSSELKLVRECVQALSKARLMALGLAREREVLSIASEFFDIRIGSPTVEGGMRFNGVLVGKRELFAREQLRYGEPWRIRYAVSWRSLSRIIRARELRFIDLYLIRGLALLSFNDLIEYYSKLLGLKVEDYITSRFEELQGREAKELSSSTRQLRELLTSIAAELYKGPAVSGRAARLRSEHFPPCIKGILAGVQSGSRNYAITVLLTSFLSYARAAPKTARQPRIRDYIKDPRVLSEEILPLIYQAASRCTPPLFEDQPGERLNILYHLGFGMSSELRMENSGRSPWYFPPNCEKIRREAPGLCRPDEMCREIKNPLSYYFASFRK